MITDYSAAAAPTLTTPTATAITQTGATLGANITSDGGASLTSRGTVWGTTVNPTGNVLAEGGTATGVFTHNRTGLSQGTRYFYRGYAVNSAGTGYSPSGSFYTEPGQASAVAFSAVAGTSMTVSWTAGANSDGTIVVMRQGSATVNDPTDGTLHTANAAFGSGANLGNSSFVIHRGAGTSVNVTGLTAGNTYYVEVFAYKGTVANSGVDQGINYRQTSPATGNQATLSTSAPVLTTPTATSITTGGATLGATITSDGGSAITSRGTVWGTTANPTGNVLAEGGTAVSAFSHARTGMGVNTLIHYRGYAINGIGTGYSSGGTFWTLANVPSAPTVSTPTATTLNVLVNVNGNPASTEFAIRTGGQFVQANGSLGATVVWQTAATWGTRTVTGLASGTTHNFDVRARNGAGTETAFSSTASGLTIPGQPATPTAASITTTSFTANWSATTGATSYRLDVATDSGFASMVSGYNNLTVSGTSQAISGLTPGRTYYVRVRAVNASGTGVNSATLTQATACFTTVTATAASAVAGTSFNANWNSVVGATGYILDVATNSAFSAGGSSVFESFETGLPTGYTTVTNYTLSSGEWTGASEQVIRGTTGVESGSYSLQLRSQTGAHITTPTITGGVGTISFYVTSSTASGGLQVRVSTDNGANWTQVSGSPISFGTTKTLQSFTVDDANVNRIQFYRTAATVYIDDVEWTPNGGGGGGDFVPGYQAREVGNVTSFGVTGLTVSVTYYYRVRATNEFCVSDNSTTTSVTTVSTSPDIEVRGNNQTIADGDTTPTVTDHTDFGAVGLVNSNLVRTYTITNTGVATLTLENVAVGGTHPGDFTVISQPTLSIAAAGTTTFQVRFDPTAVGTRTATLFITNNVGGKSPYDFVIQGTGVAAGILRSPTTINLTTMVGTTPGTSGFGVTNVGRGQLIYTISTNRSWLSVSPTGATLVELAGQQHTITFNANGLHAGVSNATITITDANASNSPQTVAVNLTLTNIPSVTAVSAAADGREMVRLNWTKPAAHDVLIAYRAGSAPGTPANGTSYSVGGALPGGGTVIYKGAGAVLEHIVQTNATHFYSFYAINNNHYSPAASDTAITGSYGDGEIVDAFAYTNGVNINGLGGGVGWSGNWSVGAGTWTAQTNGTHVTFPNMPAYPNGVANRLTANLTSATEWRTRRDFTAFTSGRIYVAAMVAIEFGGAGKYTGIRLLSNGVERAFFGETGADNTFGIDGWGGGTQNSAFTINPLESSTNNTYLVIGRYDFGSRDFRIKAYYRTTSVPDTEPADGAWDTSVTLGVGRANAINGVELVAGGFSGAWPGRVYFDELRVATNWTDLMRVVANPEIGVLGTNFSLMNTVNTPAAANGTEFGVTPVTGGTVDRTFFITNSGNSALSVTGITTSGLHAADFIVLAPASLPLTVSPGGSSNLTVRFDPSASGVRTGAVTVANSDGDNPTYVFHVRGTGSVPPSVTTTIANPTNVTTATAGGNVTADGSAAVTNRGVVWGLAAGPTVPGPQTTNGTGTGSFTSTLTNLLAGATYYYRAFAQNSVGTGYGTEYTLTTPCFSGAVTGLYASATNELNFTATWSNVLGATGYELDVATSANFDGGGAGDYGVEVFTNIGGGTSSSYLTRDWTNNGVAWTAYKSRTDQTVNGEEAVTLRDESGAWFQSASIAGGVDEIEIVHQQKFTGSGGTFDVFVNSTRVATNVALSTSVVTTKIAGIDFDGSFSIMVTNSGSVRPAFGRLSWTNTGSVVSYVPGYSNRVVAGTSQSVTGLTGDVTYYFRVRATNAYCATDHSVTASVTTIAGVPGVPANVTASDGTSLTQVEVTWSDVAGETGFSIWRHTANVFGSASIVGSTAANTTSYNDTTATPGQLYYYWVTATNAAGSSAAGASDSGYRKLAAVTGVAATDIDNTNNTQIVVTWSDINGETGYAIWRNTVNASNTAVQVGSVAANVTGFADTSAASDTTYYYWVRGTNNTSASQGDWSASDAGYRGIREPAHLGGTATGISSISLAFTQNVENSQVIIVYDLDGTFTTPSGAAPAVGAAFAGGTVVYKGTVSPQTHASLAACTPYFYKAWSFDGTLYSLTGLTASATTEAPAAPTGLYVNPTNANNFTLNWSASSGASGYRVDVSTNGIFGGSGVADDFTDGNFTASPTWSGDTIDFQILTAGTLPGGSASTDGSYLGSTNGYSVLTTPSAETNEWKFSLGSTDFDPSSANYFGVILMSDTAFTGNIETNSFNGYYLRLGVNSSTDYLELWRSSGTTKTKVGDFTAAGNFAVGALENGLNIRVTRNGSGEFTLYYATGFTYATEPTNNGGTLTDTTHGSSAYFGVYTRIADSAATRKLYFDNFQTLSTGSYVSGYENRAVAGISVSVTGLLQNTMYHYRVRAEGAVGCTGENSVTGSVTTISSPIIGISPASLDFGSVAVGISSDLTLVVTNSGYANVVVSSIGIAGTCSGAFGVVPSAFTVLPGTASNVVVTFTPAVTGACSVTLTLNNNTPGDTAPTVAVIGTGYDPSAIIAPTNVTAVADGPEMVVLSWTKVGGTPNVVVLSSSNAITATALNSGTPYLTGDSGPGDTVVAYHGNAAGGVQLIVGQSSTHYYRMFGGAGTLYSTNYADPAGLPVQTLKYEPGEIIDQFAYTNNKTLAQNNLATGQGWSGGWTGDTDKYTVIETNLMHGTSGFPDPHANKIFWQDTSTFTADDAQITRMLGTALGGRMFVAFMMNYQFGGTEKYVGVSLMSGPSAATEEIFFGKPSAFANLAGIYEPDSVSTLTTTNPPGATYTLTPGHGNDYMIVGEWYPAQKTIRMWAFATNAVIPQDFTNAPPVASYSNSSLSVATITGIRIAAGSSATPNTELGHVYFDEVRVGGTWDDVLNFNFPKVYDYQVGTQINGTNYITDGELVEIGKSYEVSYTLYHRSGITNAQFTILDDLTGAGLYPTPVGLEFGANLAAGRQRYTNSVTDRLSFGEVDLGTYTSRVYMTASSGRSTNTIVVAETGGASDLFFGEFGEGRWFDKYVEIYNGTGGSIDLSQYMIAKQTYGGTVFPDYTAPWDNFCRLSPIPYFLDHNTTILILNGETSQYTNPDATLDDMTNALAAAGRPYLITTNSALQVSGNDPVGLFRVGDTNNWIDMCAIGPAGGTGDRYIMTRMENAEVPRPYPLVVNTNEWFFRDWAKGTVVDSPNYTNFLVTAGVYDLQIGLGGFITFQVIDDDDEPPVAGPITVMLGGEAVSEVLSDPALLAGWNFNGTNLTVSHGSGTLTSGLPSFDFTTSGSSLNLVDGDVEGLPLRVNGSSNNGTNFTFQISMQDYQDLVMTFASERSGAGHNNNQVSWSTNGTTYTAFGSPFDPTESYAVQTVDFSAVTALNGAATVYIRITVGGATGTGVCRFDNVQFKAQRLVYSFTDGMLATVTGGNPLHLSFEAYDTISGLQRGTANNGVNMNVSIPGVVTNNTAAYQSALSSTNTTGSGSTSVWQFTSFSYEQIGALFGNGSNYVPVSATLADADNDRPNDALWLSNRVFGTLHIIDDDTNTPEVVNLNYANATARPFIVLTNGGTFHSSETVRSLNRRSGTGSNTTWTITDRDLAQSGAMDLQFAFGARDVHSGVARGNSGDTNTVKSFSLGDALVGNFANYDAALSSTVTDTNQPLTNIWSFGVGAFTPSMIASLMADNIAANPLASTTRPVRVTIPDTDNDRPNDRSILHATQVGLIRIIDNDARGPLIANAIAEGTTGNTQGFLETFEPELGWTNGLSFSGSWTNDYSNGTYIASGSVLWGSLNPKVSGTRRIGLLTNVAQTTTWLQLPPVEDPGTFTVFAGRFGVEDPTNDVIVRLERLSGSAWTGLGDRTVSALNPEFEMLSWDVNQDAITTLRLVRVSTTGVQVYMDDINITPNPTWISTNQLTLRWTEAVDDYSNVDEYRVVAPAVGTAIPAVTNAGVHRAVGVTNDTFSILGQQGVITGFVFAIDDDNDRPNDRAIGNLKPIVVRIDTNPPPPPQALRATDAAGGNLFGDIDESSEIKIEWRPGGTNVAQAAGWRQSDSVPLSPWDTYIVTYYEVADTNGTPAANAVTSALTRANAAWSNVLNSHTFTNLVLSNLVFDTYYNITIQGRDEAGNIGLVTSVIGNTDRFIVTQGVARTETDLLLRWTGPTNDAVLRDYDVLFADSSTGFRNTLSNQWQWMQYTNRPALLDTGGINRVAPGLLTNHTYRFYRVARPGRWETNNANRLGSMEVYAAKAVTLHPGENWYSMFAYPDPATTNDTEGTLAYVFGTNLLPTADGFVTATKISWFGSDVSGSAMGSAPTATVWLASSGNWTWHVGGSGNANDKRVPLGQGFLIELPAAADPQSFILVGRLPTQELVHTVSGDGAASINPTYHVLSHQIPERISLLNLGITTNNGFRGGPNVGQSDEIRILSNKPVTNELNQVVGSGSLISPKARIFWRTSDNTWRHAASANYSSGASASGYVVEPDDTVIIVRRNNTELIWTNRPVMYNAPTRNFAP